MAKNLGGLNSPVNESQGGTNATTFNAARTNMGLNALVNEQTAGYTAVTSDRNKLIHYTGAGGVTLAFDPAATLLDGWSTVVRNDAATAITLDPNGGELIDGAASLTLEPTRAINIYCTGTEFLTQGQSSEIDGANQALSNLASVAINTTLVSDTDVTDNLGTQAIRWNTAYLQNLQTGDTAADVLNIGAWDVDGAAISNFITLTAGNTPTCVLASGVTATTQAANDNSTKIATTAYVDAAAGGGGAWSLVSTQTASSSASIGFTGLVATTTYLFIFNSLIPATNSVYLTAVYGTGAGPTYITTGTYSYESIFLANGGGYISSQVGTNIILSETSQPLSNTASYGGVSGQLMAFSVGAAQRTRSQFQTCFQRTANTVNTTLLGSGNNSSTTAITAIKFAMSSGDIASGSISMYKLVP